MPRPLRASCDRCHSQKLKCPKQPGLPSCTRCLKAGTTCIFSPAGLTARRAMLAPACLNEDPNMHLDWSSLDWENVLGPTEAAPEFQLDEARRFGQAEVAEQSRRTSSVRQLTTLAAEIDQVSLDISSIARVHVPKNQPIENAHSSFIDNFAAHRCVEQLFILAQRLTDIYPQALKILFDGPGSSDCKDPECFHTVELPDDIEEFFPTTNDDRNGVDSFLFNLLVLCHTKVIDVMEFLMASARACTQIALGSPTLREPQVHIPEVRVGSFVATNAAASSMQAALLVHIASVLLDYARQLSKEVTTVADRNENSKQSRMLKLQCELLEEKAASKMSLLENVKGLLTRLGFLK
ncbi:hypothetical protein F4818DRAFT_216830 [Hypoxylon cercidicola]|nr:hypothetical protein F4818DRAFT_216830 [Hypoxylon cercidicola]